MCFFLTHTNRHTEIQTEAPTRSKPLGRELPACLPLAQRERAAAAQVRAFGTGTSAPLTRPFSPLGTVTADPSPYFLLLPPCCNAIPSKGFKEQPGVRREWLILYISSHTWWPPNRQRHWRVLPAILYSADVFLWKGVPNHVLGQLETQIIFPFLLPVTGWLCPWSKADPAAVQQDR